MLALTTALFLVKEEKCVEILKLKKKKSHARHF